MVFEKTAPEPHPTTLIRAVDAQERVFYRYSERNPVRAGLVPACRRVDVG